MTITLAILFLISLSFTLYMAHRVHRRKKWEAIEAIRQRRYDEDNVDLMDYR